MVYCGEEAVESFQKVVERRGSGGGERTVLSFRTMSAPAIKPMILTRLGKPSQTRTGSSLCPDKGISTCR